MNKRPHLGSRGALSLLATVLLLVTACGGEPADSSPAATKSSEPEFLYVASQSGPALSIIDMNAREVVETIWLTDLGFTANAKPHHVAVEPDGSFWYASLIADGRVLKFNRDNEMVDQATFETPGMMAIDPVEDFLYVGRSMAAVNPPQRIGVITRSDMTIEEYDVFFPRPHAIAVAPGGGRVFTASLAVNQVASVSPEEDDLEIVNVAGDTHTFVQFAVSPDGSTLVTGGQISGEVMVFDVTDPRIPERVVSLQIGGQPWHPVYSPDGKFVYFPQRTSNSVAVVSTETWELVASIEGGGLAEPHGSAISADGRTLWISGRNTEAVYPTTIGMTSATNASGEGLPAGTVVAIDTESRQIVAVLEVPAYAAGISTRRSH